MQNDHQLNLNAKYQKKEFFSRQQDIIKATSYIPRYLERKQTCKLFLTRSIHIV